MERVNALADCILKDMHELLSQGCEPKFLMPSRRGCFVTGRANRWARRRCGGRGGGNGQRLTEKGASGGVSALQTTPIYIAFQTAPNYPAGQFSLYTGVGAPPA